MTEAVAAVAAAAAALTTENLVPDVLQGPAQMYNAMVNNQIGWLNTNEFASNALRLVLLMYAGLAAPRLPMAIDRLFSHAAFRVGVLALVLWTSNNDPSLSFALAMLFVVSMNTIAGRKPFETFFSGRLRSRPPASAQGMPTFLTETKNRTKPRYNLHR